MDFSFFMTRTQKQLENALFTRAIKRFTRMSLDNLSPEKKDENTNEYRFEKYGFTFRLGENYLWILGPDRYIFESFDSSDEEYASIIKSAYEGLRQRVVSSKERQDKKQEREFNRNLKRLNRFL